MEQCVVDPGLGVEDALTGNAGTEPDRFGRWVGCGYLEASIVVA